MNRIVRVIAVLSIVLLGMVSCATNGILGINGDPLATASYVDNATNGSTQRINSAEQEIAALKAQIIELQAEVERLSAIQTNIDELPLEMLRRMVDAMDAYLENEGQ